MEKILRIGLALHRLANQVIGWFFALFIASLPLYIIRFQVFRIPSTLIEVLFFGFVLLFCLSSLDLFLFGWPNVFDGIWDEIKHQYVLYSAIAVILVCATAAIFIAYNARSALGIYKAYFIEPMLLFGMLQVLARRINLVRPILFGISLLVIWLLILCCFQSFGHLFLFAPDEARLDRATGVFTTANALGLLLGPAGAIFIGFAIEQQHKYKALSLIMTAATAVTIILSRSLTGLLGFAAAIVVIVVLKNYFADDRWTEFLKDIAKYLLVALIIVQIGFFALILPHMTPKVAGPELPSDSLTIRYYLWEGSFKMLENYPFGVGFSSYPQAYAPYRIYPDESIRKGFNILPLYPHNMLLNFWSEIGLLGALAIFALCLLALLKAIQFRRTSLAMGLIGSLVYLFIHGLADVPYFKNDLAFMFWIIIALCVSLQTVVNSGN